jgi:3'-phosphoadenosine 5'-phosphosulfate sulfotransferase (PAPS reductase)/FAD synthetase
MKNPYLLELPAAVAFSGGRTSAFMLRQILDAFENCQPDDLKVTFQNTGLEHEATYSFIQRVAQEWAVDITWLEYAIDDDDKPMARVVDFDTASRNGEPFDLLIDRRGYLPNPMTRLCTAELKMRTQIRYLRQFPEFAEGYTNAIGLRADEPRRALRLKGDYGIEQPIAPMYHAGHSEEDVLAYWRDSPFDLELPLTGNMAGNCVGCFLKSKAKLYTLEEEMPRHFDWWIRTEERMQDAKWTEVKDSGRRFRLDRPSYAAIREQVRQQGNLFQDFGDDDTIPCMCTD